VSHPKRNDPFAELYGEFSDRLRGDRWQPDVDVFETEKEIIVRVDLAGVRSSDLRVTMDGSMLRKRLHQMEIATGPFERRVRVPVAFDRERVAAHLSDGFLTVSLSKRSPVRREVKVESE
jgi:HSP20 family protein